MANRVNTVDSADIPQGVFYCTVQCIRVEAPLEGKTKLCNINSS